MNCAQVISAQANMSVANVKPRSGGRSQNYMPPEAKQAIEQAQAQNKTTPAVQAAPASAGKNQEYTA